MPPKKKANAPLFWDIQVYTQWAHKIANYEYRKAALVVSAFSLFVRNPIIQKTSTRPWEGGECGNYLSGCDLCIVNFAHFSNDRGLFWQRNLCGLFGVASL